MEPVTVASFLLLSGVLTGFIGSLLGLGGGFLLVPIMTLALAIDIRTAVAVSLVAVVATSTGAGAASLRRGVTNTRLAMFLEVATSAGAIGGAFIALSLGQDLLFALFGIALLCAVPFLLRPLSPPTNGGDGMIPSLVHPSKLRLNGRLENDSGELAAYQVHRAGTGFVLAWFGGVISGLLGIGGGIVKVPTMRGVMGVPMKVAVGTSNFMIGVTASAGALVYLAQGTSGSLLDPLFPVYAASASLGVVAGTRFGARYMERLKTQHLVQAFAAIMIIMAASMILKAAGVLP